MRNKGFPDPGGQKGGIYEGSGVTCKVDGEQNLIPVKAHPLTFRPLSSQLINLYLRIKKQGSEA